MGGDITYGRPEGEAELSAVARIHHEAFAFPLADSRTWLQSMDPASLRVIRRGGSVAAVAILIPMGQFFGGRSVPMAGIAGVATDPGARGAGLGTSLMRMVVSELRSASTPLSALYPATMPVYRRAGYEVAGRLYRLKAEPASLDLRDHSLPVRPLVPGDRPALEVVYRGQARIRPGYLDRGPYAWNRVFKPRGEATDGYVVEENGEVSGYLVGLRKLDGRYTSLRLTDLAAATPRAATRLLTLLADERSVGKSVEWTASPADPLLMLVRDDDIEVQSHEPWMLRLVHVAAALESRGWPPGVKAEIHLAVDDEVLTDNAGRLVLRVEDGRAQVRPGGEGSLRIHVRGLAALYSGFLSPLLLAQTGLCEGSEGVLEQAAVAFAGPAPSMADKF